MKYKDGSKSETRKPSTEPCSLKPGSLGRTASSVIKTKQQGRFILLAATIPLYQFQK